MKSARRTVRPPAARPPSASVGLAASVLVVAAVVAYANSFAGPFIFDDLLSIPQNPTLRHWATAFFPPAGGVTVTGRPVLNLSFAFNHALSGNAVWSYHALNLLIHVAAGLTLFGIVRRTLGTLPARTPEPPPAITAPLNATVTALAIALLWTLHPLQTESVTYIVQRAESLMGLFYLLTLYAFIRGSESDVSAPEAARRSRRWYVVAFFACLLGMGTKEVMVSAPVIVLLYDRTFLAGSLAAAWRLRHRIHLALAATWIPLALLVLFAADRGGTAGFGVAVSFGKYVATQFQALTQYLGLSLWPQPLIVDYGVRWTSSAADVVPYALLVVALIAATIAAFIRRPAFGFLGLSFFAILAPTSLVPGTRQTLAEHRMYLALAPVVVLVVLGLWRWLGRRSWPLVGVIAVALGVVTWQRNTDYRSDASIWADAVAKRPDNAAARINYGNILARTGRTEEALAHFEAAIRAEPSATDAYFNAAHALRTLGRPLEAIERYREALQRDPAMPDAQAELGAALDEAGRTAEAITHLEQVRRTHPRNALACNELGRLLARVGRTQEAVAQYEEALRLNPNFGGAHNNLGNLYRQADRQPEAIAHYEASLRLDPKVAEVHSNLGLSLLLAGRTPDAIASFEAALRLNPNLAQVHLNLGLALASIGRTDEAGAHIATARRLGATVPDLGHP